MTRRLEKASSLAQSVEVPWDSGRLERSLSRLHRRQRRRRVVQVGLAVTLAAGAALGVVTLPASNPQPEPQLETNLEASILRLPDGSIARLSAPGVARLAEVQASRLTVELSSGHATFDVVHQPTRLFVVRVGNVAVFDLGTVFSVERGEGRVRVSVESGRVRVEAPREAAELQAGESRWFSEVPPQAPDLTAPGLPAPWPQPDLPRPKRNSVAPPVPEKMPTAEGGRLEVHAVLLRDDIEEMLLAADALRRDGRADEAVPLLEKLIASHSSDPRTPLAAFTLGKIELDLGHPKQAADAFAAARTLAPGGPLVEDALGRELDAAQKAGDLQRARSAARDYLERFPSGARSAAARRALELEP